MKDKPKNAGEPLLAETKSVVQQNAEALPIGKPMGGSGGEPSGIPPTDGREQPELSSEDMQLVHQIYADSAQRLAAEGSLPPTLFLVAGPRIVAPKVAAGTMLKIEFPMPDGPDGRDQIASWLGRDASQADAVLGVSVCEGWTREDKTEVVVVSVDKPGSNWIATVTISRDGAGRPSIPAELTAFTYHAYSDAEGGRLVFLLGPATTTEGVVRTHNHGAN